MSDEINSAEAEAEAILQEALAELEANGEACPQGEACAVHHRIDEEILVEDEEYGRIITYAGEYCVVTSDNPEMDNPVTLVKLVLNQMKKEDLPDFYETCVFHVGEGTLGDIQKLDKDGQRNAVRFVQTHSEWSNFKDAHEVVVNGVKEALIDVSETAFPKGK